MKIILNKADKNRKSFKEFPIGTVYLGIYNWDSTDSNHIHIKINSNQSFNLTLNEIVTPDLPDVPRKGFPNAELHLNDE